MSTPFFSVVIPVRDKGPHIRRALSSVLAQDFQDFEIIVVNDNSVDQSVAEIERFDDPRLTLLHREGPRLGGGPPRNIGLRHASADWVAFLDADDEWYPDHLSHMAQLIERFPDCGLLSSGWEDEENGHRIQHVYFQENAHRGAHSISFQEYLALTIARRRPRCTSAICYSRRLIASVCPDLELFPAGNGQDLYAHLLLMAHSDMAWSPHLGAIVYRDSVNSASRHLPVIAPELNRRIVHVLSDTLSPTDLTALKRHSNVMLWRDFMSHRIRHKKGYFLPAYLFWMADPFYCLYRSLLSLVPARMWNGLRALRARFRSFLRHGG